MFVFRRDAVRIWTEIFHVFILPTDALLHNWVLQALFHFHIP
jgi:hypothetical protein